MKDWRASVAKKPAQLRKGPTGVQSLLQATEKLGIPGAQVSHWGKNVRERQGKRKTMGPGGDVLSSQSQVQSALDALKHLPQLTHNHLNAPVPKLTWDYSPSKGLSGKFQES